ncbi:MAG TPA: hypothetical protein VMG81_03330 [Thermoplasmata archaeon]|nr:hypothetical protein [Thermoplasmata archaeon]
MTFSLRRWVPRHVVGVAAVVAVLVGSGVVAYACGDGGQGCQGSHGDSNCGEQSSSGILWVSYTAPEGSATGVACALSISSSTNTLVESAVNLGPGQSCSFHAELKNTADQTVSIYESVAATEPSGCNAFLYSDNIATSPTPSIGSHNSFAYQGQVGLSSAAGNACNHSGTAASFSIVISATPCSKCGCD